MESPQQENIPIKERDLANSKGDEGGGTDYNPHAQMPAQGREKGKANERQQYHANLMDPIAGTPTQGAKRGGEYKKPRDSETTGSPPQAMASIGNTRSEQTGFKHHHEKANTPYRPDDTPTNQDTEPTAMDEINPPVKTEDTLNPLHQAGTELAESPSGHEGLWPHRRPGKSERPDKKAMRKDSGSAPKQRQSQPRQIDRIAVHGTEPPQAHPTTQKDEREQLPGPTAREHDGLRLDPQSATTGIAELTHTASFGPDIRRKEQLEEKRDTHTTVMSTLLTEGAKAALPEILVLVPAETKDNELVPTLTQAETTSI